MKLAYVEIKNFKMIEEFSYSFVNDLTNEINSVTTLFGDNGSGKTSILQAIALIISMATYKTRSPQSFRWHGFQAERLGTRGEPYIRVDLRMDEDEIESTHQVFKAWKKTTFIDDKDNKKLISPVRNIELRLEYRDGQVKCSGGRGTAVQLLGRYYTKKILHLNKNYRTYFDKIGDVFWFDQYRNLGSGMIDSDNETEENTKEPHNWQAGVDRLREYLNNWYMYHHFTPTPSPNDFIVRLETKFSTVFPGSTFAGVEPRKVMSATPQTKDFFFILERNGIKYDVAEMSSGEQAIFSIMYQFVWQEIARSIVLIDELELHLHPPEQQMFYSSLKKIGPDCQYIITSHSPFLFDIIPNSQKIQLERGKRVR